VESCTAVVRNSPVARRLNPTAAGRSQPRPYKIDRGRDQSRPYKGRASPRAGRASPAPTPYAHLRGRARLLPAKAESRLWDSSARRILTAGGFWDYTYHRTSSGAFHLFPHIAFPDRHNDVACLLSRSLPRFRPAQRFCGDRLNPAGQPLRLRARRRTHLLPRRPRL
jgi:hypothetical protein